MTKFYYYFQKRMSKICSISKLHEEVLKKIAKNEEKDKVHAFPSLVRTRNCQEDNCIKSLINTDRLCLSKPLNPPSRQMDCLDLYNGKYSKRLKSIDIEKVALRQNVANDQRTKKQIKASLKKISAIERQELARLRRSSHIPTIVNKISNTSSFAYHKYKKQVMTQQIRSQNENRTQRNDKSTFREKICSCQGSTKKTGFPFNKRQYQNFKLSQQFNREQKQLSVIPAKTQNEQENFISFESYKELIIF